MRVLLSNVMVSFGAFMLKREWFAPNLFKNDLLCVT